MGDRPGIAMTALDVFAFYQICNILACLYVCICLLWLVKYETASTLHSTNASYQALKLRAVCWSPNQAVYIAMLLGNKSSHWVQADHTASVCQDVVYNTQ